MTVLVEGFGPDAVSLAGALAREGARVRLAGPTRAPESARALRDLGVAVEEHVDLDSDPGEPETAYLDVWTPDVAPRVERLRASGTRVSCLGDMLLERSPAPVLGVTGTAGKTTTTLLVAHLLRAAGIPVLVSDASVNGNLWPSADHLHLIDDADSSAWLVLELTSSHLAFTSRSPSVAVVTTFWPDHLELHGSLAAYRRAKETIVRRQSPSDTVVVDVSVPDVARFAELTPAGRLGFASASPASEGARVRLAGDAVVIDERVTAPLPDSDAFRGPRAVNVAAACAAALAAGADPEAIAGPLADAPAPRHRAVVIHRRGRPDLVDDGMAATPTKARASLASCPDRSIVLVCGGDDRPGGRAVHDAPAEKALLARACDEAARAARAAVVFGPARDRLLPLLQARGVSVVEADTLESALAAASALERGASRVIFAPMFPVAPAERERLVRLARRAARV